MARDLHASEFDEATEAKLDLFRTYLREWLPVFLLAGGGRPVNIFDFFAGPGKSATGQPGSPLLILEELRGYDEQARDKDVHVYLNEMKPRKLARLEGVVNPMRPAIPADLHFAGLEFSEAFELWLPHMAGAANLLFLDQSGVRQITEDVFRSLLELDCTDFLFFVASSTFQRFGQHPSLRKYFETERIDPASYLEVHRAVVRYYKGLIPDGREYYLAGYSLKKGSNIYGLVFGTHHPLGALKFLRQCWRLDEERGEANFDIDDDRIRRDQPFLFESMNRPTKLGLFEEQLRSAILEGLLATDRDVTLFSLENGFLGKHAKEVVSRMRSDGLLRGKHLAFSETCLKRGRTPSPLTPVRRSTEE